MWASGVAQPQPRSPATPPPSAYAAAALGNDEAAAAPCFYASEDELPLLPPRLSCSRSHSMAKRRLFSPRHAGWHGLVARLPAAHHAAAASAATLFMLLLTLAATSPRLAAVGRSGGSGAAPQPGRQLPRMLLAGGGSWATQAEAPAQQPQLHLRPPSQQLWNVTLLLEVSGSGLQSGQLAGRLRQPFLQALMPAAAAAAGGAEIVGASLLWAQPQQPSSRSSPPGALASVSLLLRRQPARRLVDTLREAPVLLLPSPGGSTSSSSWTGPAALEALVVDSLLAAAMCPSGARPDAQLAALLGCGRSTA